jgi:hypothetical protein
LVFAEAILGVDGEVVSGLEDSELREIFLLSINDLLVEGGFKVFSVCERELDWVRGKGGEKIRGHVGEAAEREDNKVVIRGVSGVVVRAAAEQIGFVTFARFVMELKVVLCELDLPSSGTRSNFVGLRPVREVLVVGPNNDR